MNLAPLQRQRFIFLLGPRYKGSDKIKLVCKQYNTHHENYVRVMEILREIYWEAKRAPSTNTTALTNPYRREFLLKKFFGRTREQRLSTIAKLKEEDVAHKANVDAELMGLQEESKVQLENTRKKRREYAAKRLSLGFKDKLKGDEGVEDPILEELENKDRDYQKQIEEQKERKPVRLVTEVKAISKEEIERLLIREEDKYRKI